MGFVFDLKTRTAIYKNREIQQGVGLRDKENQFTLGYVKFKMPVIHLSRHQVWNLVVEAGNNL